MAARLPAGPGRRGGELEALFLLLLWFAAVDGAASPEPPPKCEELRLGQYMCDEPKIDNSTQEPMNCTNHTAYVQCLPAPNITCRDYLGIEKVFTGQEIVGPSDGSSYIIDYYGARLTRLTITNTTFRKMQTYP